MTERKYITSQDAWEGLNELLFQNPTEMNSSGSGVYGALSISYDNLIHVSKVWVDPELDLGLILGYTTNKWSHLVANYIDLSYLDIIKSEVLRYEKNKRATYSFAFHFSNLHNNGKDCLIGLVFSRRLDSDVPVVTFNSRATEVTKRLIFDLILIQRVVEYVYGHNKTVSLKMFIPMAYIQAEHFTLYSRLKDITKLKGGKLYKSTIAILEKFQKGDNSKISYDSHRRISMKLQGQIEMKSMKVKDLLLVPKPKVDYPVDCFTDNQRKKFKKSLK